MLDWAAMETTMDGNSAEAMQLQYEAPPQIASPPRSKLAPLAFLVLSLFCGMSWALGGMPALTDVGFFALTIICVWFCIIELLRFPYRTGVGALMLYGGVVV